MAYINISESYDFKEVVTIDDYRTINPSAIFVEKDGGIWELEFHEGADKGALDYDENLVAVSF